MEDRNEKVENGCPPASILSLRSSGLPAAEFDDLMRQSQEQQREASVIDQGPSINQTAREGADVLAFFCWQLGTEDLV